MKTPERAGGKSRPIYHTHFCVLRQPGFAEIQSFFTDEQFVNKTITLPADVTQQIVSEGCYEGRTRLGSMYQLKQYVVGVPAVDSQSGELVGIILAVMENRSLMQMWRSFIGLFFMTSAIILLIAFVVSSLTSMRRYGSG